MNTQRPKIVIIGGGFGGLTCVRGLKSVDADVTLIDRRNFHLFQPLLYQVATGGLSPANIAAPLRSILRRQKNTRVLMETVTDFDTQTRTVGCQSGGRYPFDYLVLATGSHHHYFGNDEKWAPLAPGLKTIEDATEMRKRVLSAFENAEECLDDTNRKKFLTFVVVGGGPTGIELAGAVCELARHTLRSDFRAFNPASARVILVEGSPVILERFDPKLSTIAKRSLEEIGVEVRNETKMIEMGDGYVLVSHQGAVERIETATVLWGAGVKSSPLGALLVQALGGNLELDRGGRVKVNERCQIPGHDNLFVVGDLAWQNDAHGNSLPGLAPVAMQQGSYVAKVIAAQRNGRPLPAPFKYWDKGMMATIGRSRAVCQTKNLRFGGRLAWFAWLFIHIMYLVRFENRVMVLFQWAWNYTTRNRTARLITGNEGNEHRIETSPAQSPNTE